jgi:hypothetical protein
MGGLPLKKHKNGSDEHMKDSQPYRDSNLERKQDERDLRRQASQTRKRQEGGTDELKTGLRGTPGLLFREPFQREELASYAPLSPTGLQGFHFQLYIFVPSKVGAQRNLGSLPSVRSYTCALAWGNIHNPET